MLWKKMYNLDEDIGTHGIYLFLTLGTAKFNQQDYSCSLQKINLYFFCRMRTQWTFTSCLDQKQTTTATSPSTTIICPTTVTPSMVPFTADFAIKQRRQSQLILLLMVSFTADFVINGAIQNWFCYQWRHSQLIFLSMASFTADFAINGVIHSWFCYEWRYSQLVLLSSIGAIHIWFSYQWCHSHLI